MDESTMTIDVETRYYYSCPGCDTEQYTMFALQAGDLVRCGTCKTVSEIGNVTEHMRPVKKQDALKSRRGDLG
jgi:uncharacterized Zn finger protein